MPRCRTGSTLASTPRVGSAVTVSAWSRPGVDATVAAALLETALLPQPGARIAPRTREIVQRTLQMLQRAPDAEEE